MFYTFEVKAKSPLYILFSLMVFSDKLVSFMYGDLTEKRGIDNLLDMKEV